MKTKLIFGLLLLVLISFSLASSDDLYFIKRTGVFNYNITNNNYNITQINNITNNITNTYYINKTFNITPNSFQCSSGKYLYNISINSIGDLNGLCRDDQTGTGFSYSQYFNQSLNTSSNVKFNNITTNSIKASTSAGLLIKSVSGSNVAQFGMGGGQAVMFYNGGSFANYLRVGGSAHTDSMFESKGSTNDGSTGIIHGYDNNSKEVFTLQTNGRLGLGVLNPRTTLDVNGTIYGIFNGTWNGSNTKAGIGDCPSGQFVQNITTNGVECKVVSSGSIGNPFNQVLNTTSKVKFDTINVGIINGSLTGGTLKYSQSLLMYSNNSGNTNLFRICGGSVGATTGGACFEGYGISYPSSLKGAIRLLASNNGNVTITAGGLGNHRSIFFNTKTTNGLKLTISQNKSEFTNYVMTTKGFNGSWNGSSDYKKYPYYDIQLNIINSSKTNETSFKRAYVLLNSTKLNRTEYLRGYVLINRTKLNRTEFLRAYVNLNATKINKTVSNDVADPTGFISRDTSTIRFNEATRNFTISAVSGTFNYYVNGTKCTKSNESIILSSTMGQHYIYHKDCGALIDSTTVWTFDKAQVSIIYWDRNKGMMFDERHSAQMDWKTHEYNHMTVGTRYSSGLSMAFTDTTFTASSGVIFDEDIKFISNAQTKGDVLYRNGSSSKWDWVVNSTQYYFKNATNMYYDNNGVLTQVPVAQYMAIWALASTEPSSSINFVLGQRVDTTLNNAKNNNNFESLNLTGLPATEYKLLYRVIIKNDATPYEEAIDYRTSGQQGTGVITEADPIATPRITTLNSTMLRLLVAVNSSKVNTTTLTNNYYNKTAMDLRYDRKLDQTLNTTSRVRFQNITSNSNITIVSGTLQVTPQSTGAEGFIIYRIGAPTQSNRLTSNAGGSQWIAYSSPSNAKPLIIDATTDASNTPVSAGTVNLIFRTMGVSALTVLGTNQNIGIGTTTPPNKLTINGNMSVSSKSFFSNTARISAGGSGYQTIDSTRIGLELVGNGMNAVSKYTPCLKFMSTDPELTTENPKLLAWICGRATETYSGDTNSGMSLDFATSPNLGGATNTSRVRMSISNAGDVGIGTGTLTPSAKLDVNGTLRIAGQLTMKLYNINDYVYISTASTGNSLSNYVQLTDQSSAFFDFNVIKSGSTTHTGAIRLWRLTNTTGIKTIDMYKGDNSAIIDHRIAVNQTNTYFYGVGTGNFGIGTNNPTSKFHVIGNANITNIIYQNNTRVAGVGNCPSGQFVQNTTAKGVQCKTVTASASAGGSQGNVQFNNGGTIAGSSAMNISSTAVSFNNWQNNPILFEDFQYGSTFAATTFQPFFGSAVASGTIGALAGTDRHQGIMQMSTSTTASSGYSFVTSISSTILNGGEIFKCGFRVPVKTGNVTRLQFGWTDTAGIVSPTDGLWFNVTGTTIMGIASNNSIHTLTPTTYTLINNADQWYRAEIQVYSKNNATFRLYNTTSNPAVLLWQSSVTTRIPSTTGRETGKGFKAYVNGGTTAQQLVWWDYMYYTDTISMER